MLLLSCWALTGKVDTTFFISRIEDIFSGNCWQCSCLVRCYHVQVDAVLFLLAGLNETARGDPEVQPRGGGDG